MAKRRELAKGMYARMNSQLDPVNSYSERLFAGRYFYIEEVAKEPDDAKSWGPCRGVLIYWSEGHIKQAFNDNMLLISESEQERIKYILDNRHEFKDLFRVTRKIGRALEGMEDFLFNCGIDISIWELMDENQLAQDIRELLYGKYSQEELEDIIEEATEIWQEIIELIMKLDELEEKHIRTWVKETVA